MFDLMKYFIGFGELENNKFIKSFMGAYPPYNVLKTDDNTYVIEMAVAGFGKQDLEINLDNDVLTVKGGTSLDTLPKDKNGKHELYKGIAERSFTRVFRLADTIIVKDAQLINGMLKVWLEAVSKDKTVKKIEIR